MVWRGSALRLGGQGLVCCSKWPSQHTCVGCCFSWHSGARVPVTWHDFPGVSWDLSPWGRRGTCLAPSWTPPGSDSAGKLVFSGLFLLRPVKGQVSVSLWVPGSLEQRKVGWGCESWLCFSQMAGLRWGLPRVRTVLSPIPVLTQKAPSFRLSHREGESVEMGLGAELFPSHFLLRVHTLGWGVGPLQVALMLLHPVRGGWGSPRPAPCSLRQGCHPAGRNHWLRLPRAGGADGGGAEVLSSLRQVQLSL